MYKVLHNSRCGKSREAIQKLDELNIEYSVREYLKDELTVDELTEIINKLNIKPIELVRVKETIWKENFKDKVLSDEEIIQAMIDFPKLIERPVLISDKEAVIGRPLEKIISFVNK